MGNSLLNHSQLPSFSAILPEHIESIIKKIISSNRNELNALLESNSVYTWENLLAPLEEMNDRLAKVWAPPFC